MNILVTNANGQILTSTVYSLREGGKFKIFGVGNADSFLGKHLLDRFFEIEKNQDDIYLGDILKLCKKWKIKVIIPHSLSERILFMNHQKLFEDIGVSILSSSAESILLADDKLSFLRVCEENHIPIAKYYTVTDFFTLKKRVYELGYPKKKVVVKPVFSYGSRGFRILCRSPKRKSQFFYTRADNTEITLSDLQKLLHHDFPKLIVSEYLPGQEYTIDCLKRKKTFIALPRLRLKVNQGVTSVGKMVYHKDLIQHSKTLTNALGLTSIFGFQFKENEDGIPCALECNPRIQGTTIMSTLAGANLIKMETLALLGNDVPSYSVDWGMTFYRLWSGIAIGEKKKVVHLKVK